MKDQDFVFDLVKSLDETELRFVQSFAKSKRKKPEKVIALLKDFRKQAQYAPQKLKAKYKGYEVIKFKLKQLVMRSLRILNHEETIDQQISIALANEGILFRKGIYGQARKELTQARKIAEEHQQLGRLIQILQLEQKRLIKSKTKDLESSVEDNNQILLQVLAQFETEVREIARYQTLFASYRTQGQKHLQLPPLPSLPTDLEDPRFQFHSRLYRSMSESLVLRSQSQFNGSRLWMEEAISLYESHQTIKDQQLGRYKILISNYAVSLIPEGDFEKIKMLIQRLSDIEDKNFNGEAETFQNTVHLKLLLMLNTLDFEHLEPLILEVENGLNVYQDKVTPSRQLAIWYNLMVSHFINENWKQTKEWIDLIIQHKRFKLRKEIQSTTRMLELVVNLELDLWEPLESSIVAFKRYLERNKEQTPFKLAVLKALGKLIKMPLFERTKVYQDLLELLEGIHFSEDNPEHMGFKVMVAWAKAKSEKGSLKECLMAAK